MHRYATISAYDMFGEIFVAVTVRDHDLTGEAGREPELRCSTTVRSTGESEPLEWLQQALLGLLESC
jgi:hypothetical protein